MVVSRMPETNDPTTAPELAAYLVGSLSFAVIISRR
jgi:hypothetical protein